jgi:hypothetical protein
MYLIMAFPSNYVCFGRSRSRRMIPRPAQQSGNGQKTWRWVLKACASSGSALSLDYALLENRIVVSFLVGVRVDFLLLKKNTFSCYTCIAALVSLINSEYIYLHLDFLLLKKNFLLLHLHSSPSFNHQ